MKNEDAPLDYFANLKCDCPHPELSLQDMEIIIKFHEKELAEEDKRVAGTNEHPNYGDQCHAGYAGDHGHDRCHEININRLTRECEEAKMRIKELEEEIEGLYEDLAGEDI
jgi:hypothetical protein